VPIFFEALTAFLATKAMAFIIHDVIIMPL